MNNIPFLTIIYFVLGLIFAFGYVSKTLDPWIKKVVQALTVVVLLLLSYAVIYQWGMLVFESKHKTLVQSLQIVIESITTSGYGGDAPWQSDIMNWFVLLMNLSGVLLVFLALPMFIIPLFVQAFEPHPPASVSLKNHVIICSNSKKTNVIRSELSAKSIPFVILDKDESTILKLFKEKIPVILGDPTSDDTLLAANIAHASALIADLDNTNNAIIVLTARKLRPDLKIISVAGDHKVLSYLRYAGADEVIQPRLALSKSLADKAVAIISKTVQKATRLGPNLEVTELLVEEGSLLAGKTLRQSEIRQKFGVNIIGAWFSGEFVTSPDPDRIINDDTILLVTGNHVQLVELTMWATSKKARPKGKVIIGGFGVVGQNIARIFQKKGIPYTVVDIRPRENVDIIGNITDEDVLKTADLEHCPVIVLALDDDTTTIFTTLVIKRIAPNVEIIVRANDTENVRKFYQAGADYVLALSNVTGRMMSSLLLDSYNVLSTDTNYEIVQTKAPKLDNRTLAESDIREKTGCTVVAVKRGEEVISNLKADFELVANDELIVVGTDETLRKFGEVFG